MNDKYHTQKNKWHQNGSLGEPFGRPFSKMVPFQLPYFFECICRNDVPKLEPQKPGGVILFSESVLIPNGFHAPVSWDVCFGRWAAEVSGQYSKTCITRMSRFLNTGG